MIGGMITNPRPFLTSDLRSDLFLQAWQLSRIRRLRSGWLLSCE
jgi:hypothetical protein